MERHLCSWKGRLYVIVNTTQSHQWSQCNPHQTTMASLFFGRNRKIHPKPHMECQETPNGGISLPDVKTDCTATAVTAAWSQNKDNHTDQRAQKETFEYVVQWFSTTVLRSFNGKSSLFHKPCRENDIHMQKNEVWSLPYATRKKWIQDLKL